MNLLLVSPVTEEKNTSIITHMAPNERVIAPTYATHASTITNASLHFPVCRLRNIGQSRILFVVRGKFPVSQARRTR